MPYSVKIYKHLDELEPKVKRVIMELLEEIDKNVKESVKKEDFNDLKNIVARLADAQEKTEQKINQLVESQKALEITMKELAEAQKRTEQRVDALTVKMEELAEAQKRTEQRVDALTVKMEELAEAQKRTEQRVDALTVKMEELAEAQKKTELVVQQLLYDMNMVKKQLGGLSHAVGYGIEDKVIPFMESFIEKEYGFVPQEVERKFIKYDQKNKDEINIFVKGLKNDVTMIVVGECKSQPGKSDIDDFNKMLHRLQSHFKQDISGFIVGYSFDPEVEDYLITHYPHIRYYKTYQIERLARK
ncbi:MAG: hypothetical protein KA407_05975 [Spirochaetes bacterium]|nr:hypothetical protein [Spirochaetota bacterium]